MLVDLRRRGTRRDHLLLIGQVTVPTLIVLMTTVSCSDMREPGHRVVERELPPSGRLADGENRQLVRRSFDRQPILGREQSKTSAPPKVAKAHAPARTGAPVSGRVLEKANTPPLLDAEKEQLFQEFLEWRRRHSDTP
jgi:hypothetical protein